MESSLRCPCQWRLRSHSMQSHEMATAMTLSPRPPCLWGLALLQTETCAVGIEKLRPIHLQSVSASYYGLGELKTNARPLYPRTVEFFWNFQTQQWSKYRRLTVRWTSERLGCPTGTNLRLANQLMRSPSNAMIIEVWWAIRAYKQKLL